MHVQVKVNMTIFKVNVNLNKQDSRFLNSCFEYFEFIVNVLVLEENVD